MAALALVLVAVITPLQHYKVVALSGSAYMHACMSRANPQKRTTVTVALADRTADRDQPEVSYDLLLSQD